MDFSADDLRRELRDARRAQAEAMGPTRDLFQQLFDDESTSADDRAAALLGPLARRRFLRIGGFSVLGAAVLAACGGPGEQGSVPVAGTGGTTTSAPPRVVNDAVILRTASSLELTSDREPSSSPAKTTWTTCFDHRLRSGEMESTIATGPSTGSCSRSPTTPISSASSRCSASVRLSPPRTPPPGSSQFSRPPFRCRHSRTRPCQRRIAETRTRGSGRIYWPDDPCPREPRSVAESSWTSRTRSSGTATTTS